VACIWIGYEKRAFDAEEQALHEVETSVGGTGMCTYHRRGPTFFREIAGDDLFRVFDRVAHSELVDVHPKYARHFRYLSQVQPIEEIADLPPMPSLQFFASTRGLTDGELDWLASCPSLRHIELDYWMSNADLAKLKGLTQLRTASFHCREAFADETLEFISHWDNLRKLHLSGKVSSQGLAHLKRLKQLKVLGLSGYNCDIGDLEITELEKLSQLEELSVPRRELGDTGLQYLRKALPHTRVIEPVEALY
jgi:hypothetical protein